MKIDITGINFIACLAVVEQVNLQEIPRSIGSINLFGRIIQDFSIAVLGFAVGIIASRSGRGLAFGGSPVWSARTRQLSQYCTRKKTENTNKE